MLSSCLKLMMLPKHTRAMDSFAQFSQESLQSLVLIIKANNNFWIHCRWAIQSNFHPVLSQPARHQVPSLWLLPSRVQRNIKPDKMMLPPRRLGRTLRVSARRLRVSRASRARSPNGLARTILLAQLLTLTRLSRLCSDNCTLPI